MKSFPPDLSDLSIYFVRAFETLSIATLGTTLSFAVSFCIAFFLSKKLSHKIVLPGFLRTICNVLRGIDSFVFALLLVAAVGLGPFAGMLGIAIHTIGSMTKMFAECIDNSDMRSLHALEASGVRKDKVIVFALLPAILPNFASIVLYFWEFNVRASTVLGIVGAGGIGQELRNSIDLLDFSRLFTILIIILIMVTTIDKFSTLMQRRLQ